MIRHQAAVLLAVLVGPLALIPVLPGEEPPRLLYLPGYPVPFPDADSQTPLPGYERKATWHESLEGLIEATLTTKPEDAAARGAEYERLRDVMWDWVARDFRDRRSQVEMETERRDGLWDTPAPEGGRVPPGFYLARAQERVELARKTLAMLPRSDTRARFETELDAAALRVQGASPAVKEAEQRSLFGDVADLRRRMIFSHPALDFDRILISKRPPPVLSAPGDNYYGMHNGTGDGLVVLANWKDDSVETVPLLEGKLPAGCAMHADLSFDGRRVVFAYADHTPPRDQWQFFLYEIAIDGTGLRRITGRPEDTLEGCAGRETVLCEDYDPCYLPDGGIAFISTRNQGGVRCHNGDRYCPTYLLYRCDADGTKIRALSFGEANEWDPVVMPDGLVLWTRWDYINRPVIPTMGIWTTRPDGTSPAHYFGNYTPNPCRICQTRPIPGSHRVVATTAGHHTIHAGSLILIDRSIAEDGLDAITRLTPEAAFPESEGDARVSFGSPFPFSEDLFLAEYSPEPFPGSMSSLPRRNAYGIYLIDTLGGRELIYRDPTISCFEPLPVRARPVPPRLPSLIADSSERPPGRDPDRRTGVFHVHDLHSHAHGIPRGTIRALRVNELIPQPTQRVPYSSEVRFEILKRIVGTVPVDASGTVVFEGPAGVPLQFQALDQDGMAVMTMRTFTHLQPGETVSCVGCHDRSHSGEPKPVAPPPPPSASVVAPTPPVGARYPGGFSFAKTVQPVLDRYCIECHGLDDKAGGINLLGTIDTSDSATRHTHEYLLASTAYRALLDVPGLVAVAQYGDETWYSRPKDYFAHGGRLARMLLDGHQGIRLDAESRQRVFDWLDLNAPFYGDYSWNKDEWRRVDSDGELRLRREIRSTFGAGLAEQPFAALVNAANPEESRILMAPLAVSAGGWGLVADGGWSRRDDPGYVALRERVLGAIEPLPHHDIAGTCGRDEKCLCLSCWVRHARRTAPPPRSND
ncbi:MAG: hypothetical protein FJ297_07375 [Planctomycetes bacterium]|nr:hypothetical protein [Planctomycetota bacterium]